MRAAPALEPSAAPQRLTLGDAFFALSLRQSYRAYAYQHDGGRLGRECKSAASHPVSLDGHRRRDRGDLAIGSLRDSMVNWLTTERGVHAETLLASIGAVAGFAAQAGVSERI